MGSTPRKGGSAQLIEGRSLGVGRSTRLAHDHGKLRIGSKGGWYSQTGMI
jgi:hypothetical protein